MKWFILLAFSLLIANFLKKKYTKANGSDPIFQKYWPWAAKFRIIKAR